MKEFQLFSEVQIQQWIEDLKKMITHLLTTDFFIERKMLLTEEQVADILGVSKRTMRTYRSKKKFHHIKLEGCIYYLHFFLLFDLIMLSLESGR